MFKGAFVEVDECLRELATEIGAAWLFEARDDVNARLFAEWEAIVDLGSAFLSGIWQGLGALYEAVKPILDVATAFVLVIATGGATLPLFLAGLAWKALPDCTKAGFANLVLDVAVTWLEAAPVPDTPLQVFLSEAVKGFVATARQKDDGEKVRLLDRFAAIVTLMDFELVMGLVLGGILGLLDGTLGLVLTLVQLVIWIMKLPVTVLLFAARFAATALDATAKAALDTFADKEEETPATEVGETVVEEDTPPSDAPDAPIEFDPLDPVADEGGAAAPEHATDPGAPPPEAPPILEQLKAFFDRLIAGDLTQAEFEGLAQQARDMTAEAGRAFGEKAASALWDALDTLVTPFQTGLVVGYIVGTVVAELAMFLLTAWAGGGSGWLSGAKWTIRGAKLLDDIPAAIKWVKESLEAAANAFGPAVREVLDAVRKWLDDLLKWVMKKLDDAWQAIKKGLGKLGPTVQLELAARDAADDGWDAIAKKADDRLVTEAVAKQELAKVRTRRGNVRITLELVRRSSAWKVRATARKGLKGRKDDKGDGYVTRDEYTGDANLAGKAVPESKGPKEAPGRGTLLLTTRTSDQLDHTKRLDEMDQDIRHELDDLGDADTSEGWDVFERAAGKAAKKAQGKLLLSNTLAYVVHEERREGDDLIEARLVVSPNDTVSKEEFPTGALGEAWNQVTKSRADALATEYGWSEKLKQAASRLGWDWSTKAEARLERARAKATSELPKDATREWLEHVFTSPSKQPTKRFDDAYAEAVQEELRDHLATLSTPFDGEGPFTSAAREHITKSNHTPPAVTVKFDASVTENPQTLLKGNAGARAEDMAEALAPNQQDHPDLAGFTWSPAEEFPPDVRDDLLVAWMRDGGEALSDKTLSGRRAAAHVFHKFHGDALATAIQTFLQRPEGNAEHKSAEASDLASYRYSERKFDTLTLLGPTASDILKRAVDNSVISESEIGGSGIDAADESLSEEHGFEPANWQRGVVAFALSLAIYKRAPRDGDEHVRWEDFQSADQDVSWSKPANREFIKQRYRGVWSRQHEWIPSNYFENVIERAESEAPIQAAKWVLTQHWLRTPTAALIFRPTMEGFTPDLHGALLVHDWRANGRNDELDESDPTKWRAPLPGTALPNTETETLERFQLDVSDLNLHGHTGALYLRQEGKKYPAPQIKGQERWHQQLRTFFDANARGNTPEGYVKALGESSHTGSEEIWDGRVDRDLAHLEPAQGWIREAYVGQKDAPLGNLEKLSAMQQQSYKSVRAIFEDVHQALQRVGR